LRRNMKKLATVLAATFALSLFSCGDLPQTPEVPQAESPWRPLPRPEPPAGPGLSRWHGNEGTWYQIFPMTFYDGGHRFTGDANFPADQTDVRGISWHEQSAHWGDLRGIINRLNHLSCLPEECDFIHPEDCYYGLGMDCNRSLHIDGMWLTPVMLGTSYHKYDTIDFKMIDPRLGTLDDMKDLVRESHARGIRVILDLVINHTSFEHPWFLNALEEWRSGELGHYSQFFDFRTHHQRDGFNRYHAFGKNHSWHRPDEMSWERDGVTQRLPEVRTPDGRWVFYYGRFGQWMPDLNWASPAVKREFEEILAFWLLPQSQGGVGIDGFRLDATLHIFSYPSMARGDWEGDDTRNINMLTWFADLSRRLNPNVFLVGEAWTSAWRIIQYHRPGKSSFAFDFADYHGRIASAVRGTVGNGRNIAEGIDWYTNEIRRLHPHSIFTPFITNHDQRRLAAGNFLPHHDQRKMAASILLLIPGAPFIYYGEEIGLLGGSRGGEPHSDRVVRGPMIFSRSGTTWNNGTNRPDPRFGRGGGDWTPVGGANRWIPWLNHGAGGYQWFDDMGYGGQGRHMPAYDGRGREVGGVEEQLLDERSLLRHYIRIQNMKMRHPFIAWGQVDRHGIETDDRGQVAAFRVSDDNPYSPTYGRSVVVAHNVASHDGPHGFLRIEGVRGMERVAEQVSALWDREHEFAQNPVVWDETLSAFWLRPFSTVIIREWQ